jgi:dienelactone hydrolase
MPKRMMKTLTAAVVLSLLAATAHAAGIKTPADANGPAQTEIPPASGTGRVVIVIAGKMGTDYYEDVAEKVAKLGYDTVLLSGDDILNPDKQGGTRLRQAIVRAQTSPHVVPGKVAVIGFSEGGGGALAYATRGANGIAVVILYYPETAFLLKPGTDLKTFTSNFKVPVVAFAGAKDDYKDCCLLKTIQTIADDAKAQGLPFDLVVYPNANHDFIKGSNYRAADAADAWKRTTDALTQYLGQ